MEDTSGDLLVNYEDSVAHVVDIVQNMFGDISDRNTIETVVRSCGADVTNSIETFMKLTENINKTLSTVENSDDQGTISQPSVSQMKVKSLNSIPSKGAIPKTSQNIIPQKYKSANLADDMQLKTILDYHGRGYRTLIIIRGLPGSGKSFLTRQIVDKTVGQSEINLELHKCSSDDFFYQNGVYRYDVTLLTRAHNWNHQNAANMMAQGISPVIIDNTNTEIWEMKRYCYEAVKNGYYIEILEPQTPWARKPGQLARRNQHGVPQVKIKKMLDNYQEYITVDKVLKSFGFNYPSNMKPPLYRNLPKIEHLVNACSSSETHFHTEVTNVLNNLSTEHNNETSSEETKTATFPHSIERLSEKTTLRTEKDTETMESGNEAHQSREPAIDEDCEKTININLGSDFVTQLHNLLGEPDVDYPDNIVPVVNMPMSLITQIYALWIESLSHQIGVQNEYSNILFKEDEDFARELLEKEKEFENAGKSPQIPDLKEIMDMELALETYKQDLAQWKNNTPNDMASRLTRQKLAGMFPDVDADLLLEILAAHDNNFDQTVEVLLVSQGKEHVLSEKDGIKKFIAENELKRQEKALLEQREKHPQLEEVLAATKLDNSKETFEQYRELAKKHLNIRNQNHNKAQEYCKRGMTQVASYYSQVATLHKQKHDQANNLAAAALMQLHSSGNKKTTIDLHFLYVAEAMQVLDVYLDKHISALSEADGAIPQCSLFIITGRGLHSQGGPKIKPAVRKRLQERGLRPSEVNPGLISTIVCRGDKLTHQLKSP